jgi:hypothetical protein
LNPKSETCVCGSSHWHKLVPTGAEASTDASRSRALGRIANMLFWCARCGCVRLPFEDYWMVPLDRAGDVSMTSRQISRGDPSREDRREDREDDAPPTRPGTPDSKKIFDDDD